MLWRHRIRRSSRIEIVYVALFDGPFFPIPNLPG